MQLPPLFAEYTCALLGEEEYNSLATALLEVEQPVSIRVNTQSVQILLLSFLILH